MNEIKTNLIDRYVSRALLVSGFALFGLLLGPLTYFNFLNILNLPGIFGDLSIRAFLSNYGAISLHNSLFIIPASIVSWAAIGFLLHTALKFFTTKTELVS